jgi:hypothetical protein
MNRTKQIIDKTLSIVAFLLLAGCKVTTPDWGKYRGVQVHPHIHNARITMQQLNTDADQIEKEAKYLDMSVVSYLHAVNNNKIKRSSAHDLLPDPFLVVNGQVDPITLTKMEPQEYVLAEKYVLDFKNYEADKTLDENLTLINANNWFQAYDANWNGEPSINPIFNTKKEATEYANRNNMATDRTINTVGHSYIVREVNYRYEVRQQNDDVNHLVHTSRSLKDSEAYVNEYTASHDDLYIYDLKTGALVGVSTP